MFSEELFEAIRDIYSKILSHPFIKGLTDGSLSEESFRFYVIQDALYLRDFARGLALLAARSPVDDWVSLFADHARVALEVERALHDSFFRDWGLSQEQVYNTPQAPYNLLYTSYLLRIAYERPFPEVLGAYLPCYWIYWEVGKELVKRGSPKELYRRWIDTYSSEEYGQVVQRVKAIMDEVGEGLGEGERALVKERFTTTSRLEYLFWDMAYNRRGWKI